MFRIFAIIGILQQFLLVKSVIPSGEMKFKGHSQLHLVAPASFPPDLAVNAYYSNYYKLIDASDSTGCDPATPKLTKNAAFYLFASRGSCTFEAKRTAAYNIGAKGVIVYNSLAGIYQGQEYASSLDYECDNGSGFVSQISYPVYSDEMDALMPVSCTNDAKCSSGKCLVTNMTDVNLGTKVCCAWDLYLTMGGDNSDGTVSNDAIDIPAVFIRMEDAAYIRNMPEMSTETLQVKLYKRELYFQYFSIALLYLMAVCTVTYGSYWVAHQERKLFNDNENENAKHRNQKNSSKYNGLVPNFTTDALITNNNTNNASNINNSINNNNSNASSTIPTNNMGSDSEDSFNSGDLDEDHLLHHFTETNPLLMDSERLPTDRPSLVRFSPTNRDVEKQQHDHQNRQSSSSSNVNASDDSMNLETSHAVLFVLISSMFLTLLYFIDLTAVVTIIYLVLAAVATTTVFLFPNFRSIARCFVLVNTGIRSEDNQAYHKLDEPSVTNVPYMTSLFSALCISVIWYFYRDADWAWVLQDILGVSVCLLCLRMIMLPNLKVATMLLGMAFCYDVFFVFISPYLFSSSVMEQVAVGSSPISNDPNYCEKYPTDTVYCSDHSLPMLLVVPTLFTYLEGNSMLGLGDIVLPGLLVVWAARHDVRQYGTLDVERFEKGFFPLAIVSYCVGLFLADLAVVVFEIGQPALLYIVPCLLGRILYRSYKNDSITALWKELPPMKLIAMPIHRDDQDVLLSNSNVVEAEANWKGKQDICILDDSHIESVAVDVLPISYQHSGAMIARSGSGGSDNSSSNSQFQNIL